MTGAMRAARLHAVGQWPCVVDVPVPEPGPGEVRVEVRAGGICGSDVHLVRGTTATGPLPLTLGHETAGVVEATGPDVRAPVPGTAVTLTAGYGCGACPACSAGTENVCPQLVIHGIGRDGGQAGFVVVPARAAVPVPAGLDPAVAAILSDAVATPFHAIRRSGVRRGQTAAVFGLGGLGLAAARILSSVIGAGVIGVDISPAARRRAAAFGVDEVVAGDDRPARAIRAAGGADVTYEFVGAAAVTDQAVKALRPGGTATVVGITRQPLSLLPQELLVAGELRVQGSFGSTAAEVSEVVDLVTAGTLRVDDLITHRFPLERFDEALRTLERRIGDPIRVVVEQPAISSTRPGTSAAPR